MEFDPTLVGLTLLLIFLLCCMFYSSYYEETYWKGLGVPRENPVPFLVSTWRKYFGPDLRTMEVKRRNTYGRVYGRYEDGRAILTVADPTVINELIGWGCKIFVDRRPPSNNDEVLDSVLTNLSGKRLKNVKLVVQPTFQTRRIQTMSETMNILAQKLVTSLELSASEGKPVDMKKQFDAFSMDSIFGIAFSSEIDSYDETNEFVLNARAIFQEDRSWKALLLELFPFMAKRIRPSAVKSPIAFFTEAAVKLVQDRMDSEEVYDDYLQHLVSARKPSDQYEGDKSQCDSKQLFSYEVIAQCIIFFLGGFGTTSATLAFTAYELAANEDIQERLIKEVDQVVKDKQELGYDSIKNMNLLQRVVSETLRKYSSIRTERVSNQDYIIRSLGVKIPLGTLVEIALYAVHHDPELYPDPDKYDPERFITKRERDFLPFGSGPRRCIGDRFAQTNIKICLANIMSKVRFRLCADTKKRLKPHSAQGILSPTEVKLRIELRTDKLFPELPPLKKYPLASISDEE